MSRSPTPGSICWKLGYFCVARDRVGARDGDDVVGQGERLDGRFPGHDALDELGLGLDPAIRVALGQLRVGQLLHRLRDALLVGGLGHRRGVPHQGHAAGRERASSLPECGFFTARARTTRVIWFGRAFLENKSDPKPPAQSIRS